jgi:hypothetical protein
MKYLFTFGLIFFSIVFLRAQDFAPIGAKWFYTERYFNSEDIGYIAAESVKDTVIKGKNCRQIVNGLLCGAFESSKNFVFQEDSIVYFFNQKTDTFEILYNFKAKKGDSWTTFFYFMDELDTLKVTVDSIFTVTINGHKLIRQRITYSRLNQDPLYDWSYDAEVTEIIGDSYFLFNLRSTKILCVGNESAGLRCYEDPDFGFYSTGIADSCNYTYFETGIGKIETKKDFELYPNPTKGNLLIKTDQTEQLKYEIIGLTGLVIKSGEISSETYINISDLQQGIYAVRIISKSAIVGTKKLVKN